MYPQLKFGAKIRTISKNFICNYHFYSSEILQYIARTCLRNGILKNAYFSEMSTSYHVLLYLAPLSVELEHKHYIDGCKIFTIYYLS